MKKVIKNHWLVFDAFGVIPLISIWDIDEKKPHYTLFPNPHKKILKTKWFKEIQRIKKCEDMLSPCYITISCEITFEYNSRDKKNYVTNINKVEGITFMPEEGNPLNFNNE